MNASIAPQDPWPCLERARRRRTPRVPFLVDGEVVGSVAAEHVDALVPFAPALRLDGQAVHLAVERARRDGALAEVNRALHAQGLVRAWRDETYAIVQRHGEQARALIERAAARFWGTLTFGAHANGYVADAHGRPTHLWIARRSWTKPTDPGLLDNLVGGGVPHGQTPLECLVREGWEEAGLDAALMQRAQPHSVVVLDCDIAEGLQREHLYVFDLALPHDVQPRNQDGEVAECRLMPVAEALAAAAAGEMTVDASLATLDFALRHGLLAAPQAQRLASAFNQLKLA